MKLSCMGQCYGSKQSKVNNALKKVGFENMLLDYSWFCSAGLFERIDECRTEFENKHEQGEVFVADEPEKLGDISKLYHVPKMRKAGFEVCITKAPFLVRNTESTNLIEVVRRLTKESIRCTKEVGASVIIVEPFLKRDRYVDTLEVNKKYYISLIECAKKWGVQILFENDYDFYQGKFIRGAFASSYSLVEFVDELNDIAGEEIFGLCMDVGVCNLLGQNMFEFINMLGNRIKAVRLRENDGIHDERLMPFSVASKRGNKMDWLNLIRGLRSIQFDGILIMDFTDTLNAYSHMIQDKVIELGFSTADFLAWQLSIENTIRKYNKRVLFGAGNMCRNYMKCYGEEYPPLYTCDNNEKIWGSVFEGLEIKNPEELKKLPEDCAIFICNIYYDEVEKQLRDMGIKNPIERYNDEYLPSMYTDRFDSNRREVQS